MSTIKSLLDARGPRELQTIGPEEMVFAAVTRMVEHNIGAMIVVEDDTIKGIMTERDYLRFVTVQGKTARDTAVSELMTSRVVYITPEITVEEAMAIMTEQRIRHLPVMTEGRLVGIVSIGDLVKQISRNQEAEINFLQEYISDPYPGPAKSRKA